MESKTLAGFSIGLLAGAVIGGVMALLNAPQSGKKTKKMIKEKVTELVDEVKEEAGEVVETVKEKAGEVMDTVKGAASEANRKGKAADKALKS